MKFIPGFHAPLNSNASHIYFCDFGDHSGRNLPAFTASLPIADYGRQSMAILTQIDGHFPFHRCRPKRSMRSSVMVL